MIYHGQQDRWGPNLEIELSVPVTDTTTHCQYISGSFRPW